MSKIAVIYQSKYGSTKKYAEWIGKALQADIFEASKVKIDQLEQYETIIYGGYLFAASIKGFDLIKKNFEQLKGKRLIAFGVGLSNVTEEVKKAVSDRNFTDEMKEQITLFILRGGMDFQKLGFIDKNMMKMMKKMILKKKPEDMTEDDKGMLAVYDAPVDFTDEKEAFAIVEAVQSKA